jgi:hypothetical protein
LTLGATALSYPQQEQHDQQEDKDKPAQDEKKAQPEKSVKPEEKNARPEEKNMKPEAKQAQEQHTQKAKPVRQPEHASANGAGRIPADRYKANFGQAHRFHVSESDYRNHRFQYGGYWFGFQSAWPSNWLYTQDVYVVEIDGVYYLCNSSYPGVNLVLSVTL